MKTKTKTTNNKKFDMSGYHKSHSFCMKDTRMADAAAEFWRTVPHAKVIGPYGGKHSYHVWLKSDLLTTGNQLPA